MQQRRAMRVHHALRVAGRARGVTERRGGVLVEERPFVVRRGARQQILVREKPIKLRLGQSLPLAKGDPAAHERQAWRELLDERRENRIEEDKRVFRVVHDVLELVRKQPRIDGVQDTSRAGHAIVDFEMTMAVPGEGRDPIAPGCAERIERVCETLGARHDFGVTGAMDGAFRVSGYDLALSVPGRSVVGERRNQKRAALHQPEHVCLPRSFFAYGARPSGSLKPVRDPRRT